MGIRTTLEALSGIAVLPVAGVFALASGLVFLPVVIGAMLLVATSGGTHPWVAVWLIAASIVAPLNTVAAVEAMDRLEWRLLWPVVWRSALIIVTFLPILGAFA